MMRTLPAVAPEALLVTIYSASDGEVGTTTSKFSLTLCLTGNILIIASPVIPKLDKHMGSEDLYENIR